MVHCYYIIRTIINLFYVLSCKDHGIQMQIGTINIQYYVLRCQVIRIINIILVYVIFMPSSMLLNHGQYIFLKQQSQTRVYLYKKCLRYCLYCWLFVPIFLKYLKKTDAAVQISCLLTNNKTITIWFFLI